MKTDAAILVQNMGVSWQQMLTSKLDNATKLVGPVISCQDIVWPDSVADSDRQHGQPHFSPNVFATDKVAFSNITVAPHSIDISRYDRSGF